MIKTQYYWCEPIPSNISHLDHIKLAFCLNIGNYHDKSLHNLISCVWISSNEVLGLPWWKVFFCPWPIFGAEKIHSPIWFKNKFTSEQRQILGTLPSYHFIIFLPQASHMGWSSIVRSTNHWHNDLFFHMKKAELQIHLTMSNLASFQMLLFTRACTY